MYINVLKNDNIPFSLMTNNHTACIIVPLKMTWPQKEGIMSDTIILHMTTSALSHTDLSRKWEGTINDLLIHLYKTYYTSSLYNSQRQHWQTLENGVLWLAPWCSELRESHFLTSLIFSSFNIFIFHKKLMKHLHS